jgi:Carboxypeptidase regulatory-like domain
VRKRWSRRRAWALLIVLAASTSILDAQSNGVISGAVRDETAAVIAGATITSTNVESGRQFVAQTDERGEYRLLNVPAGLYALEASRGGFETIRIPSFELLVGQSGRANFTLRIGGIRDQVTVTNDSPPLDPTSSVIADNINRRQMENLPLAGRNWMELSLEVKGITANDAGLRPGVTSDSGFQLNLDGQQVTNNGAFSTLGQPKFSREAIAEFQVITSMFDVSQGRSTGVQVQAVSKSGTNIRVGSAYGYFRDDALNATDAVAGRRLPYHNQQVGGTLGGPIVKDRWQYFASFENEREPTTVFFRPTNLPSQSFAYRDTPTNLSVLVRVDQNVSQSSHWSYRYSTWDFDQAFLKNSEHPTQAAARSNHADNLLLGWSHVRSSSSVEEVKVGYSTYQWASALAIPEMARTPTYNFPGGSIGGVDTVPSNFTQRMVTGRYDFRTTRSRHDVKWGGEFLGWRQTGAWHLGERGTYNFRAAPPDLDRRFPADAVNRPDRWDVSGLDDIATNFLQNVGDWTVDIPRPTYAVWLGDWWRVSPRVTLNYGVRYDLDRGATSPPDITNRTVFAPLGGPLFKADVHDNDNVSPRVGFAWNVDGKEDFVVRAGSGIYYGTIVSNITFSEQSFGNRIVVNSFTNDGLPGWVQNPTRNVTSGQIRSGATPQAPRVIAHDFQFPRTWQSSVGAQKRLGDRLAVDVDLIHWQEYHRSRGRDINLVTDPATGYPAAGAVADPRWGPALWIASDARADYLALASALRRRFANGFQGGVAYTLMFSAHDNQPANRFGPSADNPLNVDDASEWARSQEFQRSTLHVNMLWTGRWGLTLAGVYHYGSGNYFETSVAGNPYGKSRASLALANRLYLGPTIAVGGTAGDRYEGPTVLSNGDRVPRNALRGLPIHKVDLRLAKAARMSKLELQGILEVFNVFNRDNFGSYNGVVTSPQFGAPFQNPGNTYRPRTGQLAFRVSF